MPPKKREPPGGPAERLSSNVVAGGRDFRRLNPQALRKQPRPRRRRQRLELLRLWRP